MTLAPDRPTRPSAPPPRPRLTSDVVPPWLADTREQRRRRPRAAWTAVTLSSGAAVAGIAAMVAMAADGTGLRQRLTDVATAGDPSAPEALVRSGVRTTLLAVFGGQSLLALLLVVWGCFLLGRRSWARWLLVATGLATLGFVAVAQAVVAGGRELDRLALVVEGGLLVLALTALMSRAVGAWLRADDS